MIFPMRHTLGLIVMSFFAACTPAQQQTLPASETANPVDSLSTPSAIINNSTMLPESLDIRLVNRDQTPMRSNEWLKVQVISMGKLPIYNYKFKLDTRGQLWLCRHSGDANADYRQPFDQDWSDQPHTSWSVEEMEAARQTLTKANFATQAPYQLDPKMEGGTATVITARVDDQLKEVIYLGGEEEVQAFFRSFFE